MQQLKQRAPKGPAPTSGPLSGNWRLIYTTEAGTLGARLARLACRGPRLTPRRAGRAAAADVHKIVRGLLLGLQVRDIQQEVDLG